MHMLLNVCSMSQIAVIVNNKLVKFNLKIYVLSHFSLHNIEICMFINDRSFNNEKILLTRA